MAKEERHQWIARGTLRTLGPKILQLLCISVDTEYVQMFAFYPAPRGPPAKWFLPVPVFSALWNFLQEAV